MAIQFDANSKRVILDTVSVTATELYSRSCDWLALSDNVKYGEVFRQVGSDDLGGGLSIPPYFFLQGLWRVRPMEASHNLLITGNLFVEGGGVPVVSTLGTYQVNVNYTVPVQAQGITTSGSSGPSASDVADAVWSKLLESTFSAEDMLRIMAAALAGSRAGIGTATETYTGLDGATTRISLTPDQNGNGTPTVNGAI